MGKHRQERVSREILRVLSTALLEDAKDPNLLDVTITDISISADLSSASVRYLCPPTADRKRFRPVCKRPRLIFVPSLPMRWIYAGYLR